MTTNDEHDDADALNDADGLSFTSSGAYVEQAPDDDDYQEEKTPAELLAIIRDGLYRYVPGGGEQFLDRYLAAVAAQAPQRATDRNGWPLKMCTACHHITAESRTACRSCGGGTWRALYTIGDAR